MFHRYLNLTTAVTILIPVLAFSVNSPADPMYYNYENVGANTNVIPFGDYGGRAVNWLFLPGDFTEPTPLPAGNQITDVYFFIVTGGSRTYTDLTIKMAQDDITTLTSGQFYPGSWDTVYYNPSISLSATSDSWLGITLDSPYLYDPTRSLILSVEQNGSTGSYMYVRQNILSDIRRICSQGGPPFTPSSGDGCIVNFGVDVVPIPLPGAVVLGGLGLSFAGWRLKRRTI